MTSKEIQTMRGMAWQRAKGELLSMLETYWVEWRTNSERGTEKVENGFEEASQMINNFIRDFEENCK